MKKLKQIINFTCIKPLNLISESPYIQCYKKIDGGKTSGNIGNRKSIYAFHGICEMAIFCWISVTNSHSNSKIILGLLHKQWYFYFAFGLTYFAYSVIASDVSIDVRLITLQIRTTGTQWVSMLSQVAIGKIDKLETCMKILLWEYFMTH